MKFDEIDYHEVLFTGASNTLGKFHWYLQKAETLINKSTHISQNGIFINPVKFTDFGKEVFSTDPIHWWIHKKEMEIDDLYHKTAEVLKPAEILEKEASLLKNSLPITYKKLVQVLKAFSNKHQQEIDDLLSFVKYLSKKDVLAPIILFSHPPWAHTDLSERTIMISVDKISDEMKSTLNLCTETAFGLNYRYRYRIEAIHDDILSDLADAADPEYTSYLNVEKDTLYFRTGIKVLSEFETYLKNVREALRIILERIDSYKNDINTFFQESFWNEFIKIVILRDRIEDHLWDVKQSLDMWEATNKNERREGNIQIAKHVAAFANTEGGAIIIGLTNNIPRKIVGVKDLENRMKSLSSAINKYTTSNAIDFTSIEKISIRDENYNCLVLIIAQTQEAIGVLVDDKNHVFPIREGSGTEYDSMDKIKSRKRSVTQNNYKFAFRLRSYLKS